MKRQTLIAFAACLVCGLPAQAATGYRIAPLSEVQSSSVASSTSPALVYLAQATSWLGGVACPTEWAYFDSKLNPHFLATVLTAAASQTVLRVYVDDTLPKVNGHCQITNLSLITSS